jgi:hypothetical protein
MLIVDSKSIANDDMCVVSLDAEFIYTQRGSCSRSRRFFVLHPMRKASNAGKSFGITMQSRMCR